jgi:hypothetical protein
VNGTVINDSDNSNWLEVTSTTSPILKALFTTSESIEDASQVPFDFHHYQRALLRRNPALAEGFRRILNVSTQKP